MGKKCFVLICECYSGEDSVSAFWDEEDAYKEMVNELETEIENLKEQGYRYQTSENDNSSELIVPDGDIYYEWHVEETTIK